MGWMFESDLEEGKIRRSLCNGLQWQVLSSEPVLVALRRSTADLTGLIGRRSRRERTNMDAHF